MSDFLDGRPTVAVQDAAIVIGTGEAELWRLDRYAVIGLMADLSSALAECWPDSDPRWKSDPNREDATGRIGKQRRETR